MNELTMTFTVKQWRLIAIACALNARSRRAKEPSLADDLIVIAKVIAPETGKYDAKGVLR